MSLTKDTATTLLAKVVLIGGGLGASVLTARCLGPTGKGTLATVLLLPGMLAYMGSCGIGSANVYLIGQKKYSLTEIIANSIGATLVFSGLLMGGFWLLFSLFSSFYGDINRKLILIATLTIPFSLFLDYSTNILLGTLQVKKYNLMKLLKPLALFLCLFISFFVLDTGFNGAIYSSLISLALSSAVGLFLLCKTAPISLVCNFSLLKDSLSFGMRSHAGVALQYLNYRLDMILLCSFLSPKMVGYYAIAVTIAEMLWHFPNSLAAMLYPRTASIEFEEKHILTAHACRNTFFLTSVGALTLMLLSYPIVFIAYGRAYVPSIAPLGILLPGIVMLGAAKVLAPYIFGKNRPGIFSGVTSISLLVNLILNIILIPRIGILGAAAASSVSYILPTIITLKIFTRLSKLTLRETLFLTREDYRIYTNLLVRLKAWFGSLLDTKVARPKTAKTY